MSDVTRILAAMEQGDPRAAEQLLPLVYDDLRILAAQKLAQERPGQTLQATALVHEAYLRLVSPGDPGWDSRGHFLAAAAEAMRRILVENARRKLCRKHGGGLHRVDLSEVDQPLPDAGQLDPAELLALDDALAFLAQEDPAAHAVVKLRVFAGLSVEGAAEALGISRASAYRHWTYGRAWLNYRLRSDHPGHPREETRRKD
jgi:RNA polymerase sigma factor (TIGR02999 family)